MAVKGTWIPGNQSLWGYYGTCRLVSAETIQRAILENYRCRLWEAPLLLTYYLVRGPSKRVNATTLFPLCTHSGTVSSSATREGRSWRACSSSRRRTSTWRSPSSSSSSRSPSGPASSKDSSALISPRWVDSYHVVFLNRARMSAQISGREIPRFIHHPRIKYA